MVFHVISVCAAESSITMAAYFTQCRKISRLRRVIPPGQVLVVILCTSKSLPSIVLSLNGYGLISSLSRQRLNLVIVFSISSCRKARSYCAPLHCVCVCTCRDISTCLLCLTCDEHFALDSYMEIKHAFSVMRFI